jgi:hypothetical protein
MEARFLVASAGLGLVNSTTMVPSYEATVSPGTPNSVGALLTDGSTREWWSHLCAGSPFSTSLDSIDCSILLVAVSSAYFEMMRAGLEQWSARNPGRLRLFLRIDTRMLTAELRPYLMPYDVRLNDPNARPGTEGDFVQRALADFARYIFDPTAASSADEDAARVRTRIAHWRAPARPARNPATDEEIRGLILEHWEAVGGRSGMMLRKLRDELGVACEQGRFKALFHEAAETRQADFSLC